MNLSLGTIPPRFQTYDPGCGSWSACGVVGGGCCSEGLYGGRPAAAVCRHVCERGPRTPAEPKAAPREGVAAQAGGCGCQGGTPAAVPVVVWLGVRWWGVPYPVRLWREWFFIDVDRSGCGCVVKLKAAAEGLAVVLGCARAAWRRVVNA